MKFILTLVTGMIVFQGCETKPADAGGSPAVVVNPMIGTWQLISGSTIQGKDTTTTDYTTGKKFLKIINATHFAFVGHDLNKGTDSLKFYSSGAGTYTVKDSAYTEHLQFCSDRNWEGNDFNFTVAIVNDSLTQTGVEKVEKLNINRVNIERYVRVK
jgi:hypothetical protein